MRLLYRSDPMRFAQAVIAHAHCQSERRTKGKKERSRGGCVDCEGLTPVHPGGGAIIVGDGGERHVLEIGHSCLGFGHDTIDPIFQEGPNEGRVVARGRRRMDS